MRDRIVPSRVVTAVGALALILLTTSARLMTTSAIAVTDTLPAAISDQDFWALSEELSEPNGNFQSDNLLSNEMNISTVAAALAARVKPGGVYLGVGPEQNFTYIATIKPRIVFITDVRRGNLHLQLMYKALFELSADRAEFVSRLFSKPRPAGLSTKSSASDLMNGYWDVTSSPEPVYKANLQAILDHLEKKHGFPLSADDRAGIEYVYYNFYWYGPAINYTSSTSGRGNGRGTYGDLMIATDAASGTEWTYLASEERFLILKELQAKNLIVPLVGDFAGPKALRAVGEYLKKHDAVVSAFYLSNVETYLQRNGVWPAFCANVAAMPLDEMSVFIRPNPVAMLRGGLTTSTGSRVMLGAGSPPVTVASASRGTPFGAMAQETADCK